MQVAAIFLGPAQAIDLSDFAYVEGFNPDANNNAQLVYLYDDFGGVTILTDQEAIDFWRWAMTWLKVATLPVNKPGA
jgi:hypothetical protein